MHAGLNHTHDQSARSWVASANEVATDFPIQNLPFGVFRRRQSGEPFRGGVAIGDHVIDLAALARTGRLQGVAADAAAACSGISLNRFFALGAPAWRELRHALFELVHASNAAPYRDLVEPCLVPQGIVEHAVPVQIGDYTDYYTSLHHAVNISKLLGLNAVGANFHWMPIAYHGRVSSIDVTGQIIRRPVGQVMPPGAQQPVVRPSSKLDYELELAIYIGRGNNPGDPIALADAESHVFGIGLLNDWSARDIQGWEMQPLGPFLAKNFATTISPWIISLEALVPFRLEFGRPAGDPQPLAYLDAIGNRLQGAVDIQLEVWLESAQHRARGLPPTRLSSTSFRHQYWTVAQMVAHHAINGCNLRPGDVLGSGTVSGPEIGEAGAMMELTRNGAARVTLSTGEQRSFIEDGDAVSLRGYCEKPGFTRIGFGESRGQVLPANAFPK